MNEEERKLYRAYLAEKKAEGRSVKSIRGMRERVTKLFAYLEDHGLELRLLTAADAEAYVGWLSGKRTKKGKAYTLATVKSHLSGAKRFGTYLKHKAYMLTNPFKEIPDVRVGKKLPLGILKEKEMALLLDNLMQFDDEDLSLKQKVTRYRAHVVAELMYATGLRSSEVAGLRVPDIDFSRGMVTVHKGKGGSERVAYLNEFSREVLRVYVSSMRDLVFNEWHRRNGSLLFGTGWECFGKLVNKELRALCAREGLPAMGSHGFRHALGTHLLRAGCKIRYIQSILGHKLLRNTEVYTKVEKEDLKAVVDTYHPRRFKGKSDERT